MSFLSSRSWLFWQVQNVLVFLRFQSQMQKRSHSMETTLPTTDGSKRHLGGRFKTENQRASWFQLPHSSCWGSVFYPKTNTFAKLNPRKMFLSSSLALGRADCVSHPSVDGSAAEAPLAHSSSMSLASWSPTPVNFALWKTARHWFYLGSETLFLGIAWPILYPIPFRLLTTVW